MSFMESVKQRERQDKEEQSRNKQKRMMSLTASKVSPANSYFATYNKMNNLMTKIHPTVPQHLRMPKPSLKNVPVIN